MIRSKLPAGALAVDSEGMRRRTHLETPERISKAVKGRYPPARAIVRVALLAMIAVGCGGKTEQVESPRAFDEDQYPDDPAEAPIESVDVPMTELSRSEVNEVVDAGLGRFLQEVRLEKSLDDGRFRGFRIVQFRNPEKWRGSGLMPGDVIVAINDMPIERPEQAYAAFASLKTADQLEVTYLRDGTEMRLSLPIVESGGDEGRAKETQKADEQAGQTRPVVKESADSKADAAAGSKDGGTAESEEKSSSDPARDQRGSAEE